MLVPGPVRRLPADIAVTLAAAGLTALSTVAPVVAETPLRAALVLPFAFFFPGYAVVAALFPEAGRPLTTDSTATTDVGIDGVERFVLSVASSVFVTGLLGVFLNFTAWGIRFLPVVVATTGFTVLAALVALRRRHSVPESDRFRVPHRRWRASAASGLDVFETPTNLANVLLAATVLLSAGAVAYTATNAGGGETFSEFYLLTENDEGELTLDGYPRQMTRGESAPVVVGVTNREREPTDYTVVAQLQQVSRENATRVTERRTLQRFEFSLAHNETWRQTHRLTPNVTGRNLRVQYLLYRGATPENPTGANAYETLQFWTNVTAPS